MSRTLLVVPHFRDTSRLFPFLDKLISILPPRFSVLISDDGSGHAEVARLRSHIAVIGPSLKATNLSLLEPLLHQGNTGKGSAVIRGWEQGDEYSLLAYADADGAVSAREILRAEEYQRSEMSCDALFGSRVKMLGRTIRRRLVRHLSGRVFATLVSLVSGIGAYDTQCGLKILKRTAFDRVRPHLMSKGFAFDVELCLLLLKTGCSIVEFPLDWWDVPGSKVNLLRDSIRMTFEVFAIRRRLTALTIRDLS